LDQRYSYNISLEKVVERIKKTEESKETVLNVKKRIRQKQHRANIKTHCNSCLMFGECFLKEIVIV
jgi:hypothetical protein